MHNPKTFSLKSSRQYCKHLTYQSKSSFVPAFRLLPSAKREAMEILYAFNRFTDDLADEPLQPDEPDTRLAMLDEWRAVTEIALDDTAREKSNDAAFFNDIHEQFPNCNGIVLLPSVRYILDQFNVPRDALLQVIEGVTSDVEPQRFATFDDASAYCHQVATAVGFAALAIWGTKEPLFSEPVIKAAQCCGIAFQWTNILRDLAEDYQNNRIYIPLDELNRVGFTEKQFGSLFDRKNWLALKQPPKEKDASALFAHRENLRFIDEYEQKYYRLIGIQLQRCEGYYRTAWNLTNYIDSDGKKIFKKMYAAYHKLYEKIARRPNKILEGKIRLSVWDKIRLMF
ncbi:MAG: squalene/phytoene synthase family protein [Planctomycetaceae bacterium]|jgi:phytoene synthase|nr:squalene/phytoene synthase family protein [Planctomycetaceae bacterium]